MSYSRSFPTPIGDLTITASATGLTRVRFGGDAARTGLSSQVSLFDDYFSGLATLEPLDIDPNALPAGFRGAALDALRRVPYGTTVSYSELAAAAGNPKAARAAGSACATNPLPLVIPCHRVLPAGGGLGSYQAGADAKRWLLEHESRNLPRVQGV